MKKIFLIFILLMLICSCSIVDSPAGDADPSKSSSYLATNGYDIVAYNSYAYLDNILNSNILSNQDKETIDNILSTKNKDYNPYMIHVTIGMAEVDGIDMFALGFVQKDYADINTLLYNSNLSYSTNDIINAFKNKYNIIIDSECLKNSMGLTWDHFSQETKDNHLFKIIVNTELYNNVGILDNGHELIHSSIQLSDGINIYFKLNDDGSSEEYYAYFEVINDEVIPYFIFVEDIKNYQSN